MKQWYELINVETQRPADKGDTTRLFTVYEAIRANSVMRLYKWVCIESIFVR